MSSASRVTVRRRSSPKTESLPVGNSAVAAEAPARLTGCTAATINLSRGAGRNIAARTTEPTDTAWMSNISIQPIKILLLCIYIGFSDIYLVRLVEYSRPTTWKHGENLHKRTARQVYSTVSPIR